MFLKSVQIEGRGGIRALQLDSLGQVTVLVGPNGSGKSTILRALNAALLCLSKSSVCDDIASQDPWDFFDAAKITFARTPGGNLNKLAQYLGKNLVEITIALITSGRNRFCIRDLVGISDDGTRGALRILSPHEKIQARSIIDQYDNQHKALLANRQQLAQNPQANQAAIAQADAQIKPVSEQFRQAFDFQIEVEHDTGDVKTKKSLLRHEIDDALRELGLLPPTIVLPRTSPGASISDLITFANRLNDGRKRDKKQYEELVADMQQLLQADIDFTAMNSPGELLINGKSHKVASTGTEVALSFYALTRQAKKGSVVFWDEPENSLHSTRRHRLLDLMLQDQRQYVLATHAPEFAPVGSVSKLGRVFRCESNYDSEKDALSIAVRHVSNRREAFQLLEALGVHPARSLFTSNIIIWVEGPSDLLFYRHWLAQRLRDKRLFEGFHYTFMPYGGGLVEYLEANDDEVYEDVLVDLLSLCKHPVILVDSDIREDGEFEDPHLKRGADKLRRQVLRLNQDRSGAALFEHSGGREVENFLPCRALRHAVEVLGSLDAGEKMRLDLGTDPWPRGTRYYDFLCKKMLNCGIVSTTHPDAPKGVTRWGKCNKVEFMRVALAAPEFKETELLHGAQDLLQRLEDFITRVSRT